MNGEEIGGEVWQRHEPVLSTRQVAKLFGVSSDTVGRWCATGILRYFLTPGGTRRFYASDIARILDSGSPGGEVNLAKVRHEEIAARLRADGRTTVVDVGAVRLIVPHNPADHRCAASAARRLIGLLRQATAPQSHLRPP